MEDKKKYTKMDWEKFDLYWKTTYYKRVSIECEYLSKEDLKKLRTVPPNFRKLSYSNKIDKEYICEIECPICHSIHLKKLSHQYIEIYIEKFMSYCHKNELKKYEDFICPDCLRKYIENTNNYIEKFLTPLENFNKEIDKLDIRDLDVYCIDRDRIKNYIINIKYHNFLNTLYWKLIVKKIKWRDEKTCRLCNSQENIHVHHSDYSIHGEEIYNLEKLICLCKKCHEKFHNIKE